MQSAELTIPLRHASRDTSPFGKGAGLEASLKGKRRFCKGIVGQGLAPTEKRLLLEEKLSPQVTDEV